MTTRTDSARLQALVIASGDLSRRVYEEQLRGKPRDTVVRVTLAELKIWMRASRMDPDITDEQALTEAAKGIKFMNRPVELVCGES